MLIIKKLLIELRSHVTSWARGSSIKPIKYMFGSPPMDSHRLRNRDLRVSLPSPRTTVVLRGKLS